MASSEDFKRILELYNQESKTSGVSIVAFCQKNGIVYSQFERYHKRVLYDITYEKGYKFMKPVMKNHEVVYELDFKYLVALLECPTVNELKVQC